MMEDTTQQKRFYFYRDQLVVIALAFAMAAAIILVLGMITGKTIARRRTVARAASPVTIPVTPPTRADSAPEAQPDNNSVSKNAAKDTTPQRADKRSPKGVEPQEKSAKADSTKPAPTLNQPTKTRPQAATAARKAAADQIWTIQVKSSTDRTFADNWVDRLKAKGHEAYMVEADVKGQTWYRVRVGQLNTRQEAETLQSTLEAQEGLGGTFLFRIDKSRTPD
jgi:cell division septation protein DedD